MEQREQQTYAILNQLQISYEVYHHDPVMTIEAAKEIDQRIGFPICKNLFLSARHGTEFFLLTMPGEKKFQTGRVSKQIGVPRMTFAGSDAMEQYLNLLPGSVSPLGLLFDQEKKVKFLIDREVLAGEKIAVHPCVNTATVVLKVEDLVNRILPDSGHKAIIIDQGEENYF